MHFFIYIRRRATALGLKQRCESVGQGVEDTIHTSHVADFNFILFLIELSCELVTFISESFLSTREYPKPSRETSSMYSRLTSSGMPRGGE